MLSSSTLSILNFVFGVVLGIYLPLACLYLLHFFRKSQFGFRLVWTAGLRLLVVVFGALLVLFILGLAADFLSGGEQTKEQNALWLGLGTIFSFLGGTVLFFIGIRRGWKARARLQ
jgi:hypothetical protein